MHLPIALVSLFFPGQVALRYDLANFWVAALEGL